MILVYDDLLRESLLSNSKPVVQAEGTEISFNQILTELHLDGYIEIEKSEHQQLWRITSLACSIEDDSMPDKTKIQEAVEIINRIENIK